MLPTHVLDRAVFFLDNRSREDACSTIRNRSPACTPFGPRLTIHPLQDPGQGYPCTRSVGVPECDDKPELSGGRLQSVCDCWLGTVIMVF
jgi:hypothetical protein